MDIFSDILKNRRYLKKLFPSSDVTFFEYKIKDKVKAELIFIDSLVNKEGVGNLIVKPLSEYDGEIKFKELYNIFLSPNKKALDTLESVQNEILAGGTILLIDGLTSAVAFSLKQFEKRAIVEPPTSSVIKGPREGFVESVETNVSMLRRKLKTPDLMFETLNIGRYSATSITLVYIKGVVKEGLKEKVIKRLQNISIDAILDSEYIAQLLSEHPTSLFKQIGNTEKPDILASKILEGRLGILVDGSPIALTLPYVLLEDFQSAGDYYTSSYKATVSRMLRVVSVLLSLLLPAIYVAAELFHLQLIPLSFLLTIVNSVKGIPLSPSFEMFFTLLIFVILNEASVRMPRHVGMVVSIVGGLVLGETAVNAGIISAPALMIIALSGICLYTVPDLEKPLSVLRMMLLLIAGSIGGYGLILSAAFMLIYLTSFENYDTPLLAPFAPLVPNDLADSLYKDFIFKNSKRPELLDSPNKTRFIKTKREKN